MHYQWHTSYGLVSIINSYIPSNKLVIVILHLTATVGQVDFPAGPRNSTQAQVIITTVTVFAVRFALDPNYGTIARSPIQRRMCLGVSAAPKCCRPAIRNLSTRPRQPFCMCDVAGFGEQDTVMSKRQMHSFVLNHWADWASPSTRDLLRRRELLRGVQPFSAESEGGKRRK